MKIRKISGKPYTPFEIAIPKSISGTRRIRKYFSCREEAAAYIVRVKQKGFQNADIRNLDDQTGGVTVSECTAMWLARQKIGRAGLAQLKMVMRRLDKSFGRISIERLTHRELETWLQGIPGGYRNKLNHYKMAKRFFAWTHEWMEAIPRNPMIKVPKPSGERNPVQVLTPKQLECALKKAFEMPDSERWPLITWLALGGFAGLRTCEILCQTWEDIGLEIYVRQPKRTKRGLRPRYVEILPALEAILKIIPRGSGRIVPWNEKNFRLHRKALVEKLGWIDWPDNCLRHSYRTYHVTEFQSIEKTRVQMGHETQEMTTYQYGTPETRALAGSWWTISINGILLDWLNRWSMALDYIIHELRRWYQPEQNKSQQTPTVLQSKSKSKSGVLFHRSG